MVISIYSKSRIYDLIEKGIDKNTAIISFCDYQEDEIEFPEGTDCLSVVFYDIRPHQIPKDQYDKVLPEAKEIAQYVYKKMKENKNIICQCDYGVSRSAGLAAAIMEAYAGKGIDVFADYRYTPNQFVYNKVLKELLILKGENK